MSEDFFDDEYDPLAPMTGAPEDEAASDDQWADPSRQGGFTGGGVVRVWFDDARLSTVRVSPVWYERLNDDATLEQAFEEAFLLASLTTADDDPDPADDEPTFPDLPPFSELAVDAYAALLHDHAKRWQDAIAETQTPAPPPPARGEFQGVAVTLNRAGHPERVTFDEDWLDEAQAGMISNAVLSATNEAYRVFVPATDDHQQELDRLRREHEVLQAGFRALLQPTRSNT